MCVLKLNVCGFVMSSVLLGSLQEAARKMGRRVDPGLYKEMKDTLDCGIRVVFQSSRTGAGS